MSLDVTLIYKKPKMVKYNATHAACGSTFMIVPDDVPTEETEWSANITHNMSRMALQVPICVKYRNKEYKGTLYDYVWEPGENSNITTSIMSKFLAQGIAYMVENRKKLLPFNPANGWGSYDGFVPWLIKYKEACEDNPGCKIRASI